MLRSARFAFVCLTLGVSLATFVPSVSFHELVTKSTQIVTGRVVRSTTSWGSEHKFIWTRYEIDVDNVIKGERQKTVIVSEPGGTLDGRTMSIEGAVAYAPGEHVALFLESFPSGDKRTVGWGQGKFSFDPSGKLRPGSMTSMTGLGEAELRTRVQREMRARTSR